MLVRSILLGMACLMAINNTYVLAQKNQPVNYAEKVNTLIGTKGKGHDISERYLEAGYTFPGAMYPFGMVQFTPTFFNEEKGFVVNQLSGAGCEHMGNFPTLPLSGELSSSPNAMLELNPQYKVQKAIAGYYKVKVRGDISCELSVTKRTGMARYIYPSTENMATIIIGSGINATKIQEASIKITGPNSCEGYADGGSFCGSVTPYKVYFVAEFDAKSVISGTWKGSEIQSGSGSVTGENSGVFFTFDVASNKTIQYKFGISYVSLQNARENLKSENSGWDFDKIMASAMAAWNGYLGKIEVAGGSTDHTAQFYTHLYHSLAHPNICNDVNGEYVGADNKIYKVEKGNYYTSFSNWDTYRTQIQLISMLAPKETGEMVNSIIKFAELSGGGFPRWVLANTETGIMQGDPTSILVSNASAFGVNNFDKKAALKVMRRGAEIPNTKSQDILTRPFLDQYLQKGYMNASMMLEYTSADFAIAQFALQSFDNKALYNAYLKRAQLWKNLYNPKTNWLQSRNQDGSWKKYDEDWREASYKNYFWMIPYNLKGLIGLIGGKKVAEDRLDDFFKRIDASYGQEWFASGNEPDFEVPWTYNWTNAPYKTQAIVSRIIREQYSNRDNGLPGNDDLGAMGAWYVFANIGMFPMIPGVAGFSINSPSFPLVKIHLSSGKIFLIKGGDEDKAFVNSLKMNKKEFDRTWIPWSSIRNGGELLFQLSEGPNKKWGTGTEPPSFE